MTQKPTPFPITGPGARSGQLTFVVSARDLPMRERGCVGPTVQDPYVKWTHRDNSVKDASVWNDGGSTKHRVNNANPDYFDTVFTYQWMQGMGQSWRFQVLDYDVLNKDDAMGTLDVDVDAFVEKGEELYAKLSGVSQGALLIKKVETVSFKLAARELAKLDAFEGMSDPYVQCFWSAGKGGPETKFATTKTIKNVENCEWDEVIEFPCYQPGTNQYWVFKVFDKDPLPKDDSIGEAAVSVDEFVRFRGLFECPLSDKKGNNSKLFVIPSQLK